MSKEVQKKTTNNSLTTYQPDESLLNMAPTLSSDHLRLKKIKIHQATTMCRQGMLGDIYYTPDLTTLAKAGEKVVFYPLTYKLSWFHNKKGPKDQKPTPTGVTPWRSANQYQWEQVMADGTILRNYQTAIFYGLLESEFDKENVTPVQIVLFSTSFSAAALPLMNRYDEIKRFGVEPWLMKFSLQSEQSKRGAWYVYNIAPVSTKDGQARAEETKWATIREWTKTLLNAQKSGELETTKEELAQDIEETSTTHVPRGTPLSEDQLEY